MLAVIAEHGGDVVRLAGFQEGRQPGTSILRAIFVLGEDGDIDALDTALSALEDVLSTEYPVRSLANDMQPLAGE